MKGACGVSKRKRKGVDEQPMEVKVVGGMLVISIGINCLARALEASPRFYNGESGEQDLKVTDPEVFAREVARALQREEEDGSTPLHVLFDNAAESAIEDGCEGVKVPGDE